MRTSLRLRSLLLTASFGTALAAHAQTAPAAAPAATETPATAGPVAAEAPGLAPTTVLKLGVVLSNRTLDGIGYVVPLPLQLGLERRFNASWALTGNLNALAVAGRVRPYEGGYGLRMATLGAEVGVRRYYRAEAHPKTGAYGGNYLALNANMEAWPYGGTLFPGALGLNAQWGVQRRLGGHGLADAFVSLGAESLPLSFLSSQPGIHFISPTVELGVRLSLVR